MPKKVAETTTTTTSKADMSDNVAIEAMESQLLIPVATDKSSAASRKLHARPSANSGAAGSVVVVGVPMETITVHETSPSSSGSFVGKQIVLMHHFKAGVETWCDKFALGVALTAWYAVGVLAIVTTKLLLQDWRCPPLALTVQQMVLGTIILRLVVYARDGAAQPWPWDAGAHLHAHHQKNQTATSSSSGTATSSTTTPTAAAAAAAAEHIENELASDRVKRHLPWLKHPNFTLSGIFNALDFLASNYAFSFSSAHFVETIKASEPITTTAIALLWKVDRLSTPEAGSLSMLVAGVLLSTWGNSTDNERAVSDNSENTKLFESIQTATLALSANVFFGFRAINQKKYRSTTHETQQMDDVNFMCRMLQVGATFLLLPLLLLHYDTIGEALDATSDSQFTYLGLALVNSFSYVTYKYVYFCF